MQTDSMKKERNKIKLNLENENLHYKSVCIDNGVRFRSKFSKSSFYFERSDVNI